MENFHDTNTIFPHGENDYALSHSENPPEHASPESRMLPPELRTRVSRPPIDPQLYSKCLPFFLTHCLTGPSKTMFLKGTINNPANPNRATNVSLVVSNVEPYFFLQFKSNSMNPLLYPKRVEEYLSWLERHCLAYKSFKVPVGGEITKLQIQYNSLHAESYANTKSQKGKQKNQPNSGLNDLKSPADLRLFSKWRPAHEQYRTIYGWSPGPMENVIQVWVTKPEVIFSICRFVESHEYCTAVAKFFPYYIVRIFEGKLSTTEQQFCLDRGLVIGQFCHVYFPTGAQPVENENLLEMYSDLEYHVDESQIFPFPPPKLLPTPPMPMLNVVSFDIESNNKTTINPYTQMEQTRFSRPIWQPKDIIKHLQDQKSQFASAKKYRLDNFGFQDDLYVKLLKMEVEFNAAIAAMIHSLNSIKPWTDLRDWYEGVCTEYGHLRPYLDIPDPLDVDTVLVIVATLSVYNKPREKPLAFPETVAFVLLHPDMEQPIDRTLKPTKYSLLSEEYSRIELRTYTEPLTLIGAFVDQLHEWSPTIITGWNESVFDEPFLWYVNQFHSTYHRFSKTKVYKENGRPTEFGRPNFGMVRRFKLSNLVEGRMFSKSALDIPTGTDDNEDEDDADGDDDDEEGDADDFEVNLDEGNKKKKSKKSKKGASTNKNPSRISQAMKTHVTLPMVTSMDGLAVWQNPSFGVKSTFESKGTTPQYSLDNVSSIELRYPGTDIDLPRRKLQVSHSETPKIWKRGGRELWFFICYCYVDATLPLFLLEKHAKIQLLFALASKCNCSLDVIYNNGMQVKISALFFANARVYEQGTYLIPEWGLRGLHWPDVWLSDDPYVKAFSFPYLKPRPPGTKGYMGALVMDPSRMLHLDPLATKDYQSLYPSLASAYHFDYDKFLTRFMMDYYKVPTNVVATQVLGPKKIIFCGELYQNDASSHYDRYNTTLLKDAKWYVKDGGFINSIITGLMSMRKVAKNNMALMVYNNKMVSVSEKKWPTPTFTKPERDQLVPVTLMEKLGKMYWERMYAASESLDSWKVEHSKIQKEMMAFAQPGITDLSYITSTMIQIYDAEQLALKLILNSIYGFTAPNLASASLPLMELAASITSKGRRVIRMTGTFCESRTIRQLKRLEECTLAKTVSPWPLELGSSRAQEVIQSPLSQMLDTFDLSQWVDRMEVDDGAGSSSERILLEDLQIPEMKEFVCEPEALKAVQEHYDEHHLPDHLKLHGGDTDSVMIGYPRAFCLLPNNSEKEDHALVQRLATLMVLNISKFLHGCMTLTQEKTAKASLMVDPKNYYMSVLGMKKILSKGVEIVRGDTFGFCSRILGYAADELIHKVTYANFKETFQRVFKYVHTELLKVAQGKVVLSEFIKHKKLAKVLYTNMPEHAVVAQKMNSRGHQIGTGDFVVYTYADVVNRDDEALRLKRFDRDAVVGYIDKKGGVIAEDVNYLIETGGKLDVEHCMKLIIPIIVKFFRHIVAPRVYPPLDEMSSMAEMTRVNTLRAKIRDEQNQEVNELMFKSIEDILKNRLVIKMRQILKMNTINAMFLSNHQNECQYCNRIFDSVNRNQVHCPDCLADTDKILDSLQMTLSNTRKEINATYEICRNCIDFAGFPDIEIERCTKYDCEINEKRTRLRIDTQQAEKQLMMLKQVTSEKEEGRPPKRKKIEVEFTK